MNQIKEIDYKFLFLLGMLVFLPGIEALKNIFAFLFVISWIFASKKNKYWGGDWRIIDSIFALWIFADIVISVNAVINHEFSGSGFRDIIRFVLIAWVLSRIDFSKSQIIKLTIFALVGTLLTIAYSYYSFNGAIRELHSVGHINHTAIFLLLAYTISFNLLLFEYHKLNIYQNSFLAIATIILFFTTVDTESRATMGLIIFVTFVSFLYFVIRKRNSSIIILFFMVVSSIGVFFSQNPPYALERLMRGEHILHDDSRQKIRTFSYYAFKENPLLGIGFGNYGKLKLEDIKDSVINEKGIFDPSLFLIGPHTHNVYFNYLVSGGILIFSIFMWFWFYIIWIITRLFLSKDDGWIVICGLNVMFINLGIGWVNTSFHHEHALLSMFVLGLLISKYRSKQFIKKFN
jgi:hypothetical protein